jgi:gamma-glutamyltranspeptidase/glutathione hydrolase
MNFAAEYPSRRPTVFGGDMVATSQSLAAQAGLSILARGGNAIDAAIATAMTLTVVEPTGNGIGGDAFAIVWDGTRLHGLNASGRAPRAWTPDRFAGRSAMPETGWESVTVPGAVSAWIELWRCFGSLELDILAAPAIRYARDGFQVTPIVAALWKAGADRLRTQPGFAETFLRDGKAPAVGERVTLPGHAYSLERIVASQGEDFYRGELAERMIAHASAHGAALHEDDLAGHKADWVGTIALSAFGVEIHEIPPNGQGIATLIALGILEKLGLGSDPVDDIATVHLMIEATKLALADVSVHVGDPDAMRVPASALLDSGYLAERGKLVDRDKAGDPGHGTPKHGGTVYLCAADRGGRMISYIQSNYMGFGSGVVVPGTGISLQNRGVGFNLKPGHPNVVAPGKRPFHTIIPGFALDGAGNPLMAFGVMGGPMQAQGHVQMAVRILCFGQSPQAAADAPRWRVVSGRRVSVESNFPSALAEGLRAKGHDVVVEGPAGVFGFGGAQAIFRTADGYIGGSDPRKDGQVVAF